MLESRKSARLINSDTDFSKLADVNIISSDDNNRGVASNSKSKAIEVPNHLARSDYVQISGSRKRRTSEHLADEEEVMTECSAAMLLMKLSCSPSSSGNNGHAPNMSPMHYGNSLPNFDVHGKPIMHHQTGNGLPSPVDSSGASSFRSATPSPPLSSSTGTSSVADEGIVRDFGDRVRHGSKPVSKYQKQDGCPIPTFGIHFYMFGTRCKLHF